MPEDGGRARRRRRPRTASEAIIPLPLVSPAEAAKRGTYGLRGDGTGTTSRERQGRQRAINNRERCTYMVSLAGSVTVAARESAQNELQAERKGQDNGMAF